MWDIFKKPLKKDSVKGSLQKTKSIHHGEHHVRNLTASWQDEEHKASFLFQRAHADVKMLPSSQKAAYMSHFVHTPPVLQRFTGWAHVETQGEAFTTTAEVV